MNVRNIDGTKIIGLSSGSHKRILFNCDVCDIEVEQPYRTYIRQNNGKFCRTCRNKHTANRPDVKEKQSSFSKEKWLDNDYRYAVTNGISEARKKEWADGKRKAPNKTDYNVFKEMVESEQYTFSTNEEVYNKNGTIPSVTCPMGHTYETMFSNWKTGHRCFKCSYKRRNDGQRYNYYFIKNYIKDGGYDILTAEGDFIDCSHDILIKCPNDNHEPYNVSFTNFKYGNRCLLCFYELNAKNKRIPFEDVAEFIKNVPGYEIVSTEYHNNCTPLDIKCDMGHIFSMRLNNFKVGQRCPKCSSIEGRSPSEKDVHAFIQKIYKGKILTNDRSVVWREKTKRWLELDIHLPDIKLAIEHNSWIHTVGDNPEKDILKAKICEETGILLYVINYDDWQNKKSKEAIKNEISDLIRKRIDNICVL